MAQRFFLLYMIVHALVSAGGLFTEAQAQNLTQAQIHARRCAWVAYNYNRCEQTVRYEEQYNRVVLFDKNETVACTDGLNLPFRERLVRPDISSVLSQTYALDSRVPETRVDYSPGGIRNDQLMGAVYGRDEVGVRANLVRVNFLGRSVNFNKKNGAAKQLAKIDADLRSRYYVGSDKDLVRFLGPILSQRCGGSERCEIEKFTFAWRKVAGTNRPSNHSYGVAIDLLPESGAQYWLWDVQSLIKGGKAKYAPGVNPSTATPYDVTNYVPRANPTFPQGLVESFEKHGFIWGGKWYRYDVMHFEYRPEFFTNLQVACN